MPEKIEHRHPRPSLRVGVLIVDRPGQDEGDGGEEACRGGIYACISPGRARSEPACNGDEQVSGTAKDGVEDNVVASVFGAIRQESGE